MKITSRSKTLSVPLVCALSAVLLSGVARAEAQFIQLSNDTQRTLTLCAAILAGGMIIAALILRKPHQ